jgi:hypothetical protein
MRVTLIGIDCATDPSKVGLALGEFRDGKTRLMGAQLGGRDPSIVQTVAGWIRGREPVLLALDAPLGWPAPLGAALVQHVAGEPLRGEPNALFRRDTDRVVKAKIGRLPLDVGADRIARTAHAALALLAALRAVTGQPIPLAWQAEPDVPVSAIEVYPAGTLQAHGLPASGYKEADRRPVRTAIIDAMAGRLHLPADTAVLAEQADVLDAALCILAAHDFLCDDVIKPSDPARARKEGWIWVRGG